MKDKRLINELPNDMRVILRQPYALTMARHKLNVHEMRIMMRIMEALQSNMSMELPYKVGKDNIGNTTIRIPVKCLLPAGSKNYQSVRNALDGLTKKHINMKFHDKKGLAREVFTNLVMEATCEYRDEFAEVQLSKNLMPQIISLAKGYTRYLLGVAFNSSSPSVIKLYYFVSHFRDKRQISVTLELLRKLLSIEEKYTEPRHVKQWVLKPAIQELKGKADVWFDIAEVIKRGRRVVGWKFNIFTKRKAPKKLLQEPVNQELIQRLVNEFKLSERQARKVAQKVPSKELGKALYAIKILKINHKLSNIGGYTAKVLGEKFSLKL